MLMFFGSAAINFRCLLTLSIFQRTFFLLRGAKRDRTANLRLARAALSQLSYSPGLFPGYRLWQRTRKWA